MSSSSVPATTGETAAKISKAYKLNITKLRGLIDDLEAGREVTIE
jgi:hypothetical protein